MRRRSCLNARLPRQPHPAAENTVKRQGFRRCLRAVAAVGLLVFAAACDKSEQATNASGVFGRPDAETLRIACRIKSVEVDYFSTKPPVTPLRTAMDGARGSAVSVDKAGTSPQPIVGYVQDFSSAAGKSVELHYAGELVQVGERLASAEVFNGHTGESEKRIEFSTGEAPLERESCDSWYAGCNFSRSFSIDTSGLPSGVHHVFLTDDKGAQSQPIYFHVSPTIEEVRNADVVVLLAELTWYAYNSYGGGSLYFIQRTDKSGTIQNTQNPASLFYAASMRRPILSDPSGERPTFTSPENVLSFFADENHRNLGLLKFQDYDHIYWNRVTPESQLIASRYLRENGLRTVTIAQTDLEAAPGILAGAKVVLLTGHNEYWTGKMLNVFRDYVEAGGRVANFSGNVAWWRINLENGSIYQDQGGHVRKDTCENRMDPEFRDTGLMYLVDSNRADSLFAVNYRFANFPLDYMASVPDATLADLYGVARRSAVDMSTGKGFVVTRPEHPIFAGLGVSKGQRLGADVPVMAVELDGVPLMPDGTIDRSWPNAIPPDTSVLGTATTFVASYVSSADGMKRYIGIKDVGIVVEAAPFGNGSPARVVSFGSIGYVNTLAAGDNRFGKILLNTIEYLSRDSLPPVRP